jgi:hypothetical protein
MGDFHIRLYPHLPAVSRTMSLMTTYPLVSTSYMLPVPSTIPSFFFGQIYGRNGGISHSHYIHMTETERCKKSGAIPPSPEKKKTFFTKFCEGRRRSNSRRSKAKPRGNTKGAEHCLQGGWSIDKKGRAMSSTGGRKRSASFEEICGQPALFHRRCSLSCVPPLPSSFNCVVSARHLQ